MISPKITSLGYSNLWTDMSTILGYQPTFNQQIQKLFANDEQGFFYDPNDLSTLYQDATGTVPVTDVGQSVGLILDKSGRNNHASQTNSASRPILRQNAVTGANYLEFDGTDDFLGTKNIDFTATDQVSVFAGVRKLNDGVNSILYELSNVSGIGNPGSFRMLAPPSGAQYDNRSTGTIDSTVYTQNIAYKAPHSAVLTAISEISSDSNILRVNGTQAASGNSDQGTGNYGNYPLYIGRRAGAALPFNGHLYSLIGIGKLTSDSETKALEKELAKRVGVSLNV